ncbi:MAG TPA: transporter substrate-binding domain-containing protein [Candidatus Cloacimonadota bacterium]|nr:transporter substrate-binding domain-containing protein [Candidatus Cloacimonadota bacterium]HPT72553.1 transporter substrate-binding domain-containing protein [Candidatus Cloacimonadota bacterium]
MYIRLLLILSLVLSLLFMFGCKVKAPENNKLIVGMELAYPPFEMTDSLGTPTGISVDMAKDLGKALGKEVKIENIGFDGLIPALISKKIDIIISSMTITEERSKTVDFSNPYLETGLCLLISKKSPVKDIRDLDDPHRTVAVKKGTTGALYAADSLKKAKVLVLDKESACVLEVVQGKADAFIYDQMSTYVNWSKNRETTKANLNPFKKEYWGIAMRKGEPELKGKINDFLQKYKKDGGFERLGDRYLKEQKELFKQMGYLFYF